jgi:hypothetical protein
MTVTQINSIRGNIVVQTGQLTDAPSKGGFQNSLEIALAHKTPGTAESEQTAALSEPQPPHNTQAVAPSVDDVVGQTDSLLDLLDAYADGLENPTTSMKDLASLVDRIKDGAQQLMISTESNPTAESGLKDIAKQAAITANAEYIKFQRGDFI